MLDEANARIILLTAPAGYGKTTLAQQWLAGRKSAWYRGSPASSDVAALAVGLAVAAAEIVPGAADRLRERLRATNQPEEEAEILAELLAEDLSDWPSDAWLAIDDYQFAMEADAAERFVERLTETPLRILVASRTRPSWATARHIVYGEIFELERDALAMRSDEARRVLEHRGDEVPALVTLAEGWPAVIGLAALADRLGLPDGDLPIQLYDYFAEEVYNQAEPAVRWGLCQLAVAPSITTDLAHHLFGVETGSLMLEHGVRLGVFVPERPHVFALHPLLRTFLHTKLREHRDVGDLVGVVTEFLLSSRKWDDALTLIEQFPSEQALASLIECALDEMLREGRLSTIERWVTLGRSSHIESPLVDLADAEVAFCRGDYVRSHTAAAQAAAQLGSDHGFTARALVRAGKSAHLNNRDDLAVALHKRAQGLAKSEEERAEAVLGRLMSLLELEDESVDQIRSELDRITPESAITAVRVLTVRGRVALWRGLLREQLDTLAGGLQLLPAVKDPLARSSFAHVMAYAFAIAGRYREALRLADATVAEADRYRLDFASRHGIVTQAIAHLGLRHFAKSSSLLDRAERLAVDAGDTHVQWSARAVRLRLGLAQHQTQPPADHRGLETVVAKAMYGEYVASLALTHACRGEAKKARALAGDAAHVTAAAEARSLVAWAHAIAADVERRSDATELTLAAFRQSIEFGFLDAAVCAYRGYPPLLETLVTSSHPREPLLSLMAEAQDISLGKRVGLNVQVSRSRNAEQPLTKREAEVYELLRQGLSNRDIAKTLFISEATVKLHVRHILAKLGARTRTEAALMGSGPRVADRLIPKR